MGTIVLVCGALLIVALVVGVPWLSKHLRFEAGFKYGVQEAAKAYEPQMQLMQRRVERSIEQAELSYHRGFLDGQQKVTALPAPLTPAVRALPAHTVEVPDDHTVVFVPRGHSARITKDPAPKEHS